MACFHRHCHEPAVVLMITCHGAAGLCARHDTPARIVVMQDAMAVADGRDRPDVIVAELSA